MSARRFDVLGLALVECLYAQLVCKVISYGSHTVGRSKQPRRTQPQRPRELDLQGQAKIAVLFKILVARHVCTQKGVNSIFNQEGADEGHCAVVLRGKMREGLVHL